jgi:hypothetical protein
LRQFLELLIELLGVLISKRWTFPAKYVAGEEEKPWMKTRCSAVVCSWGFFVSSVSVQIQGRSGKGCIGELLLTKTKVDGICRGAG